MNDLRLKCTRYTDAENDFARLYVKDVDDNPPMSIINNSGPSFDSITVIDKDAVQTKFFMCSIKAFEPPIQDGDWKIKPLLISYSHKEEV